MNRTGSSQVSLSRRAALGVAGGATAGLMLGAVAKPTARAATAGDHRVFFGWVLGSPDIIAVAIDVTPDEASDSGSDKYLVKAYVCDGLGLPDGIALWFKQRVTPGESTTLAPPVGGERLVIDAINPAAITGAFIAKDGIARRFASFRAVDGAGIYDVTLSDDLAYSGTSTDGAALTAKATQNGKVMGSIVTADGAEVAFAVNVLSRLSEQELTAHGLPVAMRDFADVSIVPDAYVAVISPGGAFWLGRSGDIRGGSVGPNTIGLDMQGAI